MQTLNKTIKEFQKNLIKNINNLDNKILKEKWVFRYDNKSDIMYFAPEHTKASKDSVLTQTKEDYISYRLNTKGDIEAIVINDFDSLFLDSNPVYKILFKFSKPKKPELKDITIYYKSLLYNTFSLPAKFCNNKA